MQKSVPTISKEQKLKKPILAHLTIGDWSGDGHEDFDKVYYEVNYPVKAIRQAYKDSCHTTKLQFHNGKDYKNNTDEYQLDQALTEYMQNYLKPEEVRILETYGVLNQGFLEQRHLELTNEHCLFLSQPKDVAEILMRFIALSLPDDFTWKESLRHSEPINGWHTPKLNHQFGYGIYDVY